MATELDLLNDMLLSIGDHEVGSADDPDPDAVRARRLLATESKLIQTRGWWCNTESWTLTPQGGMISLPNNCLKILDSTQYIRRGLRVYDVTNHTYQIDTELTLTLVLQLTIEELPESMAQFIGDSANLKWFMREDGDMGQIQVLSSILTASRNEVLDDELRFTAPNILTGNPTVSGILNKLTKRRE